jgi:hypothetical protein
MVLEGDYWSITYGEESANLKDTKGAQYVAQLLCKPNEQIDATELHGGTEASLKAHEPNLVFSENMRELEGLYETLQEIEVRIAKGVASEEDHHNKDAVKNRVSELTKFGGGPRRGEVAGSARSAVTTAIAKFIEHSRAKGMPEFASHLDRSIRTGQSLIYLGNVRWNIRL